MTTINNLYFALVTKIPPFGSISSRHEISILHTKSNLMKAKLTLTMFLLFAVTTLFAQGMAKERKSPHETVSKKNITITYGRPYKKGRDIFGGIVPYDQVWRTGADEATEITLSKDCMFAGKSLKAGTYVMYTIPGKTSWTIILNSELAQWGAFGYDKVKDKNVLEVSVPAEQSKKLTEEFTIKIAKKGFTLCWDKTKVKVPVRFK